MEVNQSGYGCSRTFKWAAPAVGLPGPAHPIKDIHHARYAYVSQLVAAPPLSNKHTALTARIDLI